MASDDQHACSRGGDESDDADDAEHHQHPQQRVVDIGGRQADDDRLLRAAGVVAHHPVAAEPVEIDGRRIAVRRDLCQLFGCRGTDPGSRAVGGDHARVDGNALGDDGADHAGGLAGGVEELRAGSLVLTDDDAPRMIGRRRPDTAVRASRGVPASPRRPEPRRRRRPELEDRRRAATGLDQLLVQLMHQKALQRKLCRDADAGAHHREQRHLGDQQPGPQRPRPRRPDAGQQPRRVSAAGLRTYPAPRSVWIIGSRPLSIFLRR